MAKLLSDKGLVIQLKSLGLVGKLAMGPWM